MKHIRHLSNIITKKLTEGYDHLSSNTYLFIFIINYVSFYRFIQFDKMVDIKPVSIRKRMPRRVREAKWKSLTELQYFFPIIF